MRQKRQVKLRLIVEHLDKLIIRFEFVNEHGLLHRENDMPARYVMTDYGLLSSYWIDGINYDIRNTENN